MKFLALFIGILVIISWILVIKDSKNNGQKTEKSQNIMLIACLLTLIMTILQIFY